METIHAFIIDHQLGTFIGVVKGNGSEDCRAKAKVAWGTRVDTALELNDTELHNHTRQGMLVTILR